MHANTQIYIAYIYIYINLKTNRYKSPTSRKTHSIKLNTHTHTKWAKNIEQIYEKSDKRKTMRVRHEDLLSLPRGMLYNATLNEISRHLTTQRTAYE